MNITKKIILSAALLLFLSSCGNGSLDDIKNKLHGLLPSDAKSCNEDKNKDFVIGMIYEQLAKRSGVSEESIVLDSTYEMLTTKSKTDFETTCDARIVFSYPKELQNPQTSTLDLTYIIQDNEILKNHQIITVTNYQLEDLIDFQKKYPEENENYLFKRYSVKKIRQDNKTDPISYSKFNDSLLLGDWIPETGLQKCEILNQDASAECTYLYKKEGISVKVVTKKMTELDTKKFNEVVVATYISKIQ